MFSSTATGRSRFLKGIVDLWKSFSKLVLTSDLFSRRFVLSDLPSAPSEMRPCLREKTLKQRNITTLHKQRQIITELVRAKHWSSQEQHLELPKSPNHWPFQIPRPFSSLTSLKFSWQYLTLRGVIVMHLGFHGFLDLDYPETSYKGRNSRNPGTWRPMSFFVKNCKQGLTQGLQNHKKSYHKKSVWFCYKYWINY